MVEPSPFARSWTDEQIEVTRRMREEGHTSAAIARVIGRTDDSVRKYCLRHNIVPLTLIGRYQVSRRAHPFIALMFRVMSERKITMRELARKSGVSEAVLSSWARVPDAKPNILFLQWCFQVLELRIIVADNDGRPVEIAA